MFREDTRRRGRGFEERDEEQSEKGENVVSNKKSQSLKWSDSHVGSDCWRERKEDLSLTGSESRAVRLEKETRRRIRTSWRRREAADERRERKTGRGLERTRV